MVVRLVKEVCGYCNKTINIGQATTECYKCDKIAHTKCINLSDFVRIESVDYCVPCSKIVDRKYNPYKILVDSHQSSEDPRFYDEDPGALPDFIHSASNILQSCKSFSTTQFNDITQNLDKNTFSSYFLNIDGNQTNFDQVVFELSQFKSPFSVIGFAETNTSPSLSHLYQITDYTSYYQDTYPEKHKGTGVALYLHHMFNAVVIDSLSDTTENLESLFIKITNTERPITVGVIYRPPNGSYDGFLTELELIKESLPAQHTVYIMGDFNVDLLNENPAVSKFENVVLTSSLTPLISIFTHERMHCKRTCIDNILTNNQDNVIQSGTITNRISDHLPVFQVSTHTTNNSRTPKNIQYYDYSKPNVEIFVKDLKEKLDEYTSTDALSFSQFISTYNGCLDNACKLTTPKTSKRNQDNNPWFCQSIAQSIETRQKLYDKWCKTRTASRPRGNLVLHAEYSSYRYKLKQIIKFAKSRYYCNKITEHQGDSKATWKIINQLRGKSKCAMKPNFIINNTRVTERRVIANAFNSYFTSIASRMNTHTHTDIIGNVLIANIPSFSQFLPTTNPNSIFLRDCSLTEIEEIVSKLQNGKSSDIPVSIVKKTSLIISPFLETLFNESMKNGIFPSELKLAKVTPIYKKDNAELLGNYRPVSVLPIFGKIFEKIIYSRLYSFLTTEGILHEKQYGFRRGHSTSQALNYSVELVQKSLSQKQHVLAVFIDLSKAFDTLDHTILLNKLHNYGIRGKTHKLLTSYLTNRYQYTNALGEDSDKLPLLYGVPQGSCLGPLLFLIYINDICKSTSLAEFVLFADDTNIFVSAKTRKLAYECANSVLEAVSNYMKANKLHINQAKCCYMYFNPNKKCVPYNEELTLTINNNDIELVHETKFLGVIIDDKLSWTPHIQKLTKKLKCHIGCINRIKNNIPSGLHKQLYHTLFESHLTYGITVWGGGASSKLEPLLNMQKKCLRILFGDKEAYLDKFRTCARSRPFGSQILGQEFFAKENSKPLYNDNEILTIHNLYLYHTSNEVFKIIKYRTPISLYSLYIRSTRKESLLITPTHSHHFIFKSSEIWNLVRQKLKITDLNCVKFGTMKTSLKSLITKYQKFGDYVEWNNNELDVKCALKFNCLPDFQYGDIYGIE
jgi:hypothetical protein